MSKVRKGVAVACFALAGLCAALSVLSYRGIRLICLPDFQIFYLLCIPLVLTAALALCWKRTWRRALRVTLCAAAALVSLFLVFGVLSGTAFSEWGSSYSVVASPKGTHKLLIHEFSWTDAGCAAYPIRGGLFYFTSERIMCWECSRRDLDILWPDEDTAQITQGEHAQTVVF